MELALLHKNNFHKVIPEADEFFYPLVLGTPLLQSRFIGKGLRVKLRNGFEVNGVFLGAIASTLQNHFRKHAHYSSAPSFLDFESESDWLLSSLKSRFDGVKFYSNPAAPPYVVALQEIQDFVLFSAHSEAEQADDATPEINYNLIVTNEAIDKLVSFVKRALPRSEKKKHLTGRKKPEQKQLRLGRFNK